MSWRQSLPSFPETYTSSRSFYYQRKLSKESWSRSTGRTKPLFNVIRSSAEATAVTWCGSYSIDFHSTWNLHRNPGSGDSVLILAKEATIGLRLSFTEVWYEAHLHFPFYCPRPLKQHETNLIGSPGGNQLGTIVYLKIVYWTCLISIECSLNCAAVATQRLFCIELLFRPFDTA